MKKIFSVFAAALWASVCSASEVKPIFERDFEGFKKFKAPSARVDRFDAGNGRRGTFCGKVVPGAGVNNSVGLSCVADSAWCSMLPLDGKEFCLEMKFKLVKPLDPKKYATLFAYTADEKFRKRMIVWIHPRGRIEVSFEILTDKKKAERSFALASPEIKWQTNKYYSLRFSCVSGGRAELELDGKTIASCEEGAMSLGDLRQPGDKFYSMLYFGYYPFYGPKTAPSAVLQGYADDIKVYNKVVRKSAAGQAASAAAAAETGSATPHLCLDGQWSSPFLVADQPGKLLGTFQRADEKFWQNAAKVRAKAEQKNLVVEFDCPVPGGMKTECRPDFFWSSDRVELFIQPDPADGKYYQYSVNAKGESYAGIGMTQNRKTQAGFEVRNTDRGFSAKITVPLSELGLAGMNPGYMFKANFMRAGKTCGGGSFWAPTGDNWHAIENFATVVCGSRKAYFEQKLAAMKKEAADLKLSPEVSKNFDALSRLIAANGDDPGLFDRLEKQFAAMEFSIAQIRFDGAKQLIWRPRVWENNMNITRLARPLKTIRVYMPRNGRRLFGFAVSNLEQTPFLGQIKVFNRWPYPNIKFQHFGRQEWNAFLAGIKFYEGVSSNDVTGRPVYDALAPLHMNTLLRIPPRTTAPVWMEISSKGLAPGRYTGHLVLKNCGGKGGYETALLEVAVSPTDIEECQLDNLQGNAVMMEAWHHGSFRRFFRDFNYNYLYIWPGRSAKMRMYLRRNSKTGKWIVPEAIRELDEFIERSISGGYDVKRLKLCIYLAWNHGYAGVPDTPQWEQVVRVSLPFWLDRLEKKYGIPHEHVVFYPIDEPNGDVNNPKSSMAMALRWCKLIREAAPRARIMVNPLYAEKSSVYETLAPYCDVFECYRPGMDANPAFVKRLQKLGKEVWTYNILRKQQNPELYRVDYWKNCRDGFAMTHFWDFDDCAGGDCFDSGDITNPKGRIRRDDYAMAYVDFNYGTLLASRRFEAAARGFDETRVAWLCRKRLKSLKKQGVDVTALEKELQDALEKGASGSMDVMDQQADVILALSEKIIKLDEEKNGSPAKKAEKVRETPEKVSDAPTTTPARPDKAVRSAVPAVPAAGPDRFAFDFEKYAAYDLKGSLFDRLPAEGPLKIVFFGHPVKKQGVGSSVAIKCMNTRNQFANLFLRARRTAVELKFKLEKPVSSKEGAVLCAYVADKANTRRMMLWITPKGQLEAVFRLIDPETKKIVKNMTLTSEPCSLKPGTYRTVRLETVSGGRAEIFLDGQSIASCGGALSFSDLEVKTDKPYKVLYLGFYPFYMDPNTSRRTLNGYIDDIKITSEP